MLCAACEAIFRDVYLLGSNKKIPWAQDLDSFHRARLSGCQICNFLWTHLPKYLVLTELKEEHFPCQYAFELHNADWAQFGRDPEYLEIQVGGDETEEFAEERAGKALSRYGSDYNVHKLRYLLKKQCQTLLNGEIEMWAVLSFDFARNRIRLPMQVHRDEAADELAQLRLSEQSTTRSAETLQIGKHWLLECISNHPECKPVYEDASWHPSRLMYIGTVDQPALRLILGSTLPPNTSYATLSHCWGDTQGSVFTRKKLTAYFDAIPPNELSATARDAVHVAKALGIEYLWIDGFCIIQGDEDDWQAQSAQMAKVYGFSTCTIAAASSRSGSESFLCSRNQYAIRPCEVPNPFSTEANLSFQIGARSLGTIFDEEVKETMWHNRGWVFQERLLSQRLLIFGATQMMWSCQRLSAAESWPGGRSSKHHIDRFESFEAEKLELHRLLDRERRLGSKDEVWESVVQRYTKAEIRNSSDRLIALQGIASRVIAVTGRHYNFGLWLDNTLPESLLWHVSTVMIGPPRTVRNVPSWSWGSVAVPVEFLDDQTRLAQLYVTVNESRPLEGKQGGSVTKLEIRGPLFEMTMGVNASKQKFELRREQYFEVKRRQSAYQGHLLPLAHRPESTENRASGKIRRFTAVGIKARTMIRHVYVIVSTALPLLLRPFCNVLQAVVYNVVPPFSATTQPWRHRIYGKCIEPLGPGLNFIGKVCKYVLIGILGILAAPSVVLFWVLSWMNDNRYTRPLLSSTITIGWWLWQLLAGLVRGLWFVLWRPFWWIGYKLHGDRDWDWILLWNLTIPFPYLFPGIFGELRPRPRTSYEWSMFYPPGSEGGTKIPEGPSYDEWIARAMPGNSGPFLNAECWLDAPLESKGDVQVTCMLVIRRFQIYGLLLQPIQKQKNQYRRVGMFKASKFESCFAWTEDAMQSITLI